MKKAFFLLLFVPLFALAQKEERIKIRYDTITKTLSRERTIVVTEIIDTARINNEIARLSADISGLSARIDSLRGQIKNARKLIKGKKGGGNSRSAETPQTPATKPPETKPKQNKAKKQ